ncbi:HAD family phosphatase [Panacibacter sp. DH6]|uniref:HAD family phosphatase n=1 Tax=Panacibacter microcysteis TaxID=2793269 RepID=A0A931E5X9_9BACT|nr:HAD family phosphatase [Panacibacter microcysteis]MBG9375875.1 HAD family phosphatase [Panacibacter microcysteis]
MQKIKNIIFDLGGIFINIDFKKTEQAFISLGITNFNDYFTQHHASDLFELLETGKISQETFCDLFRSETKTTLTDNEITAAWNALLMDFPSERLEWLDDISKRYSVYLFSNTNKIHYDAFMDIFAKQAGHKNFNDYFIKAYYSHDIGLRKPYPASFEYILQEQQLQPSETLFIDDTWKNIEGAKGVGLQTIHLVPPKTVLDLAL